MWFKKKERFADFGKTKKSTSAMISEAVSRQNSWMARRRTAAARLLRKLGLFAKAIPSRPTAVKKTAQPQPNARKKYRVVAEYWFPILCAIAVTFMLIYVVLVPRCFVPKVPEPIINPVQAEAVQADIPTFDMVRIDAEGKIMIAGRWLPGSGVSVKINGKMVATEQTNARGEFVYSPSKTFAAGNYVIRLSGVEQARDSKEDVFVYISEKGVGNSMSLLMTKDGSRFLQKPKLQSGDLTVSKIDYLENGRMVVQGTAIPRTRVTLSLDNNTVGMTRVSDHKNFGIGADIGTLEPGKEYTLRVRLHDGEGNKAHTIKHKFTMPEMLPGDDTWYTVRRGDSLWIIARNFLGQGVRYTLIVEKNDIKNPNLIYPKQKLQVPIEKKK
ncbi:MAG: LysM peptidoglycan-binding domain-containing protein [Alphaproteobacteria bacterium]|nr:LysM peptidoglycan-binding domain-containing protein [Alphaproteobacteria bacterium]